MQSRYCLRFETGDRQGEVVPVTGKGITLGRRPGNVVQILDPSVSGSHAELILDERGTLLRDLGSTNGTRVGDKRISEHYLAHGDEVFFGNVRMTFIDSEIDAVPARPETAPEPLPTGAPARGSADAAGEGVKTISADKIARSGKRSFVALGGALVLIGGVAVAWFALSGSAEGPLAGGKQPVPVPGNLLEASFSFEAGAGDDEWEASESESAEFGAAVSARRTGRSGLRADLAADERAEHRSKELTVPNGRALRLTGSLRADALCEVSLGLVFESSTGAAGSSAAWSRSVTGSDEFETVELACVVPRVYDRARAVIVARSLGKGEDLASAHVDDVSVVVEPAAPGALVELKSFQLVPLGDPLQSLTIAKLDAILITALELQRTRPDAPPQRLPLTYEVFDNGVRIQAADAGPSSLSLRVEPGQLEGGVATTGTGGYRRHQVEFERGDVSGLWIGSGRDLVRFSFGAPASVRGRPHEQGFRLEADLAGPDVLMQISFTSERVEAENLAREAQLAEEQGQRGRSLSLWSRLRDELPFDAALVERADAQRSRLVQEGMAVVQEVKLEFERARFFRLVDIFRQCEVSARECAETYSETEVESAALELLIQINAELDVLEADLDEVEVLRLISILGVLEARQMPQLAARVRGVLRETYGIEDPSAFKAALETSKETNDDAPREAGR